jgi:hypothetical protein
MRHPEDFVFFDASSYTLVPEEHREAASRLPQNSAFYSLD